MRGRAWLNNVWPRRSVRRRCWDYGGTLRRRQCRWRVVAVLRLVVARGPAVTIATATGGRARASWQIGKRQKQTNTTRQAAATAPSPPTPLRPRLAKISRKRGAPATSDGDGASRDGPVRGVAQSYLCQVTGRRLHDGQACRICTLVLSFVLGVFSAPIHPGWLYRRAAAPSGRARRGSRCQARCRAQAASAPGHSRRCSEEAGVFGYGSSQRHSAVCGRQPRAGCA